MERPGRVAGGKRNGGARVKRLLPLALGVLVLLLVSYCLGRRDAPGKQDAVVSSLLDGIKGYHAENARLRDSMTLLTASRTKALARSSASDRRYDSLAATRTPVPAIVPAACQGWALNLATCDQEQTELKGSLAATREALDATARLQLLAERKGQRAEARVDTLTKALRRARSGDYVLGLKLPSRGTSFLVGGVVGALTGVLLTR